MSTLITKTRFAPSPTGLLHIGNVRTALFSLLLAQHLKGDFLLRIEDTDRERSKPEYSDALMRDLHWLGLEWQEGPYWQSQRQDIYDQYYHLLEQEGLAYPCFCTEQQLAITRKIQLSQGKPPRYNGACRHLTHDQIEAKKQQGLPATLRFAVPPHQVVVVNDMVRGEQKFQTDDLGDFIIRRTDGTAPFLYCSVLDDALMGVTHVLRGEDHIANTPRQLLILQALKLPAPQYGHINLIVGKDGAPLSKRHGSRSIPELRAEGFLASGIINYLARLGHYYQDDTLMSLPELAQKFSLQALGRAPARFDEEQLLHWQKEAIQQLDLAAFWQWLGSEVQALIPTAQKDIFLNTIRANITFPQEASYWAKIFFTAEFSVPAQHQQILAQAGKNFFQESIRAIESEGDDFNQVSKKLAEKLNIKGKALFQPLRVALTGELHGPEMAKIFELLGPNQLIKRFQAALEVPAESML